MAKRGPHPGKPSGKGKGILQRAVSEAGLSRRQSALIVDTVIPESGAFWPPQMPPNTVLTGLVRVL